MSDLASQEARVRVLAALYEQEIVAECQRLIRFPSVTGQEHGISAYLAERLHETGLRVECQETTPGRYNVIGTLMGTAGGPHARDPRSRQRARGRPECH